MLDMKNTETYTEPVYVTSKGNIVVFKKYGWVVTNRNYNECYDKSEVNEIWREWSLYWNGV